MNGSTGYIQLFVLHVVYSVSMQCGMTVWFMCRFSVE